MERVQALNIDVLTGAVNPMPRIKDAGDEALYVEFYSGSFFNDTATREQGRPVFEMRDFVKIMVPGDMSNIIDRPVRDTDLERWPRQYEAYKLGKTQSAGYPLTEVNWLSKAQIDELSYFKMSTLEQLATCSDATVQRFMGLNALRERAKVMLEEIRGEQPALKLQAAIETQAEENAALRAQLDAQAEMIRELQVARKGKGKKGEPEPDEE